MSGTSDAHHSREIVIEARRESLLVALREAWSYRELLWVLIERDLKVRYKQTVLGAAWAALQPLLTMVVFTVVFGKLAKIPSDGQAYPLFVFSGLLPWTLFATTMGSAASSLVSSSHMLSKVYFPRLLIPFSSSGTALADFGVATAVLLTMMVAYQASWSWALLAVPLLALAVLTVALGVGCALAALTVRYRDFRFVVPFLGQIWMYATPIVYPATLIPEQWRWALYLNPMAGLIGASRHAFLGTPLDTTGLAISVGVGLVAFAAGIVFFEREQRAFADVV